MGNAVALAGFKPAQVALIKQTVAKDCNETEFDLFMEAARAYGLDPFRKQISALVFNKGNADKRQMAIIVSRDGYRVMAQRCGDYRPASEPPEWDTDETAKSPTNPAGLIRCAVRLWKQDRAGQWFPVYGEAYWDEFAPVKEIWAEDEDRKRRPTGRMELDKSGNWARMPRVMLQKCAEAQALRAGWPDTFGGVYAEEELHRVETEMTASEIVAAQAEATRVERIGGRAINACFDGTGVLERVPLGSFADRCAAYIGEATPEEVYRWSIQNREALKDFWAHAPGDALAVKKMTEEKVKQMRAAADEAAA